MPDRVDALVEAVAGWKGISVEPHHFGGQEFCWGNVEIGHVHRGGLVDIPFPRRIRDQLVAENQALPHHVLPDTGWISFGMRSDVDLEHARWLLRLSYLQKRLRRDFEAHHTLRDELEQITFDLGLRDLTG